MEPISLIVAAVVAGVSKGVGDEVAGDVRKLYQGLRERLIARFGNSQSARTVLQKLEEDPGAKKRRAKLADVLADHGAADDDETLALARQLIEATGTTTVEAIQRVGKHGKLKSSAQAIRGPVPKGADVRVEAHITGHGIIEDSPATIDFNPAPPLHHRKT